MAHAKEPWTDIEIAILKMRAGSAPVSVLAKELNRTIGSVTAQAAKDGLSLRFSGSIRSKSKGGADPGERTS
jgi:hypothetical protein